MGTKEAGTQTDIHYPLDPFLETDVSDKETERAKLLVHEEKAKKMKSLKVRTVSSVALIAGFLGFIWAGHVPCMCLLVTLQVLTITELFAIARVAQKDRRLPGFRAQQWYFFVIAEFFLLGRFIKTNLLVEITSDRWLAKCFLWLLRRHNMVSYALYMAGFVSFVLGLKKGMYLYQFSQFAWTHTIILVVIVPSSFIVSNLFEGIIWWLLPALLVVSNDICAYLAGFVFGRTPLIKLSPKKTVEGFVGGALGTVLLAYVLCLAFSQSSWLTCPRRDLSLGSLNCTRDDIYITKHYTWVDLDEYVPDALIEQLPALMARLPPWLQTWLQGLSFTAMPIQVHAMWLALFASLIAPFGGFCASGFKRAFKLKDFGHTIPGHGGITDRLDCQVLMAVFMYVYYWTYISKPESHVGDVLGSVMKLSNHQQVELFGKVGNMLVGEGLLPNKVMKLLAPLLENGTMPGAIAWSQHIQHELLHNEL